MATIYRVVGDHGELARIRIRGLRNADGEPITSGEVVLRARGLFEQPMVHESDGDWHADPEEGDLSEPGRFPLEVTVGGSQVTIPARQAWALIVRGAPESAPTGG